MRLQPSSRSRHLGLLWLTCLIHSSHGFVSQHGGRRSHRSASSSVSPSVSPCPVRRAAAADDADDDDNSTAPPKKATGVYSRPSAAIERGSGFFVPGLEGPRVRLVGGLTLLILSVVNHNLATNGSEAVNPANTFAEGLAGIYSILVLMQALIEFTKEMRDQVMIPDDAGGRTVSSSSVGATASFSQQWSMEVDPIWRGKVEWAATLFLSLTPATHVMLIGPGKILYWLGSTSQPSFTNEQSAGCVAALETVAKSKGGRVSLPETHPAVKGVAPVDQSRSVVLQRVDDSRQLAILMTSDQLLPSFTKEDLQWLGQLASYVVPQ